MTTLIQRSLAAGEIAPALYGRVDTVKYQTGLKTLRNFMVMRHGGAQNRPGTEFVCEVKDSTKAIGFIPFIFNADQTYVLEFGNLYMRPIRDGAQQFDLTLTITGISNANPGVVTYTGSDPTSGDEVYISGVVGAIGQYVNNRNFKIANVDSGANTFELQTLAGANFNTTSLGSYTSDGTAKRVYTITTPYVEADLPTLQFVQSADVITIVHPNYSPRELARTGHTTWTLSEIDFVPNIDRPTGGAVTSIAAGSNTFKWRITAVAEETGEESLPGYGPSNTITGVTQANPAVVTYSGTDNVIDGDEVYIEGIVGMTELNGRTFTVAGLNTGANTFQLSGEDSTGYTAYSSGGTLSMTYIRASSAAAATTADPMTLSWTAVDDTQEYIVYQELNGVYGFIGIAGGTTFNVVGVDPDTTETPPIARNPFDETGDYPSAVTYAQQRLIMANTDNEPEKVFGSKTGKFKNFTTSSPIQDDDAVTWTMAGRQVNEVRHLLDIGNLLVFTTAGEWSIQGDASGIIKPGEVNPKQYSYNGSSTVPPLVVGGNALYIQARGSIVRDLGFEFQSDSYKGNDLTIFSAHMFDGYTIENWAYQQIPHSIVWAVRDDGTLLGLTYIREHQLWGWHRHDTDGLFENVCVVPEGTEDAVYVCVNRTIGGATKRYIERLHTRMIGEIEDSVFMDSSLSYDGRNAGATTMTMSEFSSGGWLYTSTITVTASVATFASTDVGNAVHINGDDDDGNPTVVRVEITSFVSSTVVRGKPNKTVPTDMRAAATTDWSLAVDEVSGLWHLEGKAVSVFADGFVVANPNNDSYTTVTVTNGIATLDKPYAVIHVGLPYLPDIETLDIDTPQGETLADKQKMVSQVTLHVESSRGVWIGSNPPTDDDDDPKEGLQEYKTRNDEAYDNPVELETGKIKVNIQPEWNSNGRVFIRQLDPIPLAVLSIAPSGWFPLRG